MWRFQRGERGKERLLGWPDLQSGSGISGQVRPGSVNSQLAANFLSRDTGKKRGNPGEAGFGSERERGNSLELVQKHEHRRRPGQEALERRVDSRQGHGWVGLRACDAKSGGDLLTRKEGRSKGDNKVGGRGKRSNRKKSGRGEGKTGGGAALEPGDKPTTMRQPFRLMRGARKRTAPLLQGARRKKEGPAKMGWMDGMAGAHSAARLAGSPEAGDVVRYLALGHWDCN